jgi:alanyl-tRNA synthetase
MAELTATRKLYFERELSFCSEIVAIQEEGGHTHLVLRDTAFYPEGGGQPSDRGTLTVGDRTFSVEDVQIDEAGVVRHRVSGELAELTASAVVTAQVEPQRRREFTALHTAQHCLSRALELEDCGATVSARLGGSAATIDVSRGELSAAALARAEKLANSIVDDNVLVRAWFPDPHELARLPLRRAPKVEEQVRVIAIGDFDFTPCGGTHCTSSSEMGVIAITGTEKHKGLTRIRFTAGPRARSEFSEHRQQLARLAVLLGAGGEDVESAVSRLRSELSDLRRERGELRARLTESYAAGLETASLVVFLAEAFDAAMVREVANRIAAREGVRAVVGVGMDAPPSGRPLVVVSGKQRPIDARRLLGDLTKELGGRGGGRPDFAEGRLSSPASEATLRETAQRLAFSAS